jgi:hypothetical protein
MLVGSGEKNITSFKLTKYDLKGHTWTSCYCCYWRGNSCHWLSAPSKQGPAHYRGFTITLRHSTVGRTPLDEWSGLRRNLYLSKHNTHKKETSMPPAGFGPAIPSERPQIHALDRAAPGTGTVDGDVNMNSSRGPKRRYTYSGLRATCFSRGRERIWFYSLRLTVDENWYPGLCVEILCIFNSRRERRMLRTEW